MVKYKILILTDHSVHSKENSVYDLANALRRHPKASCLHVASRGNTLNSGLFFDFNSTDLEVFEVKKNMNYQRSGKQFLVRNLPANLLDYDVLLLRLPRPIPKGFFDYLANQFNPRPIINNPKGIEEVGSKAFLLNFPSIIPPSKLCRTLEEIKSFGEQFPIVLKPVENYGGKGIIRLENGFIFEKDQQFPLDTYKPMLLKQLKEGGYLAMQFLKNVSQGDKRIVVVDGQVVGASLRLPPKDSWLCNAAQGGSSHFAQVDEQELDMTQLISEKVKPKGIVVLGIDTLVNDDGKRILSEINTLSVGGIKQIAKLSKQPLVEKTADLIMGYISKNY